MFLNIVIFSFNNSNLSLPSYKKKGTFEINTQKQLYFLGTNAEENIEWEIKSTCPITLEIITDYDYFILEYYPDYATNPAYPEWMRNLTITYYRLFTNSYEDSGIINLKKNDNYHFLFTSNGAGTVDYTIKFDSRYFNFIWIFYGFLIFFVVIGYISLRIKPLYKNYSKNRDILDVLNEKTKYNKFICSYCKNEINNPDKPCIYCSSTQHEINYSQIEVIKRFCKACGTKLGEHMYYCSECGTKNK
ncbi:MAG: hypothetical protein JXA99_12495 [Candidatus Lokiarchaeota archaeon]|nr:hypothetical protein [Candidatus Lokiarchaeota archaeon]